MTDIEIVVAVLIAWSVSRARRASRYREAAAEELTDTSAERAWNIVRDLVVDKLSTDPALQKLEAEVADTGQVDERTRLRVMLAVEDATEEDHDFAVRLQSALGEVQRQASSAAQGGIAVSGTTAVSAQGGIAIGAVGRDITLGPDLDSEDGAPPRRGGPTS